MNHKKELLRSLWVLLFIIQKSEGVDSRAFGPRSAWNWRLQRPDLPKIPAVRSMRLKILRAYMP